MTDVAVLHINAPDLRAARLTAGDVITAPPPVSPNGLRVVRS